MEGRGVVDLEGPLYKGGKGTLNYLMKDPAKAHLFKHPKDEKGEWAVRDDVWVWYKTENAGLKTGALTFGFTGYEGRHHFGPELQFGQVLGDYHSNHVLLIKSNNLALSEVRVP